jgi:hypothetical protein
MPHLAKVKSMDPEMRKLDPESIIMGDTVYK